MDGLLGKLKGLLGDEAAKWKRSATLLSGIPKTFQNNPRNAEFLDAVFGLGGIVPGVGDYLSALEAKYRWDQGDKLGAGLAGLGALPLIPAIGGMFIGKGAKTWDVLKNAEAVKMEQAGVDPRTIWKETGNWKAPDGQWRQEIPDNTARLKGLSYQGRQGMDEGHGELSGILEHANLYSAYPDTAKIQSSITQGPRIQESGSYSIDGPQYHEFFPQLQASGTDAKSPILHELQHAIQQREGWARGGSPENLPTELRAEASILKTQAQKLYDDAMAGDPLDPGRILKPGAYKKSVELANRAAKLDAEASRANEFAGLSHDAYRRLAGEAEARATQARMNMDMPTRLNTFPPESYDVPLDQLIVRYGDGPSMMADDLANAPKRRKPK